MANALRSASSQQARAQSKADSVSVTHMVGSSSNICAQVSMLLRPLHPGSPLAVGGVGSEGVGEVVGDMVGVAAVGEIEGDTVGAATVGDVVGDADGVLVLRHWTRFWAVWGRLMSSTLGSPSMPCSVRRTRLPVKMVKPWIWIWPISQLSLVVSDKESWSRSGMAAVL